MTKASSDSRATAPRWGVIGTGDISDRVIADLTAIGAEITAVWGRSEDRVEDFARRHGIPQWTTDRGALLARSDVDIVYIATPSQTHYQLALEALDAGKHVLVEKPIATSAEDAERLFARAREVGRFLMEAMWMRFNPLHVELLERIAHGELGRVTSVRASFGTAFHPRPGKDSPARGGSILRDRGIYPVTLAHWFLGTPADVSARGVLMEDVDVSGHATLDYGKAFAQLAWSGTEFLDLSAAVSGELGWITLEPMFWAGTSATVRAGNATRIFRDPERIEHPRIGNGYKPMLEAVSDAVAAGKMEHPWHDAATTIAVTRTLDRILAGITT
ncbi:Gfo/Idh/MocA family protein [Microbacterium sp.]|uniref:Gfo/Idh/MocA family protein n=1 Tax=Microbacterium sp. TaxID=51671 RepID=UPI00273638B1|nr:Gfo/Idh/MocA family oxidoreductase [Microbacterium sp.]MDP3950927.1 Gfo/Idh/MocA family oxidoreductase [Microbacterium sp.]